MPTLGTIQPVGMMLTPKPMKLGATDVPKPLQTEESDAAKPRRMELRKLRKAVADFESLFLAQLLKSMQGTVTKTKIGTDSGSEVLQEVGWEKVGESLAHQGGIGLGDMLFEALSQRIIADPNENDSIPPTLEDLVGSARLGNRMTPLIPTTENPEDE